MARSRRTQDILQFGLLLGILLFVNIMANAFYTHLDLTEEKRFTLTKPTKALLKNLDDRIYVQVLLDGQFPAGFKRLQTATREMLDDFRSVSGYIDYKFSDPNQGTVEEINERRKALSEDGINPINLRVAEQRHSTISGVSAGISTTSFQTRTRVQWKKLTSAAKRCRKTGSTPSTCVWRNKAKPLRKLSIPLPSSTAATGAYR
jgi:hypothetical protein